MGQMFYYIDHPRTPSFLIGLIKAEFDFIVRHSVHPSPFLLEAGAGVEPPTKFKKRGGARHDLNSFRNVGPSLAASLEHLAHRQNVACLSQFYRYYFW